MNHARTLQGLLVIGATLAGCSGKTYPVGSQEPSVGGAGGTAGANGSSVASGGGLTGGNSSAGQTGGTSPVETTSAGGASAVATSAGGTSTSGSEPQTCPAGTIDCICYPSGACASGLTCSSNSICVSSVVATGGAGSVTTCATGSLDCACYASGACASGLTCNSSKLCVASGVGSGGTGAGGTSASGSDVNTCLTGTLDCACYASGACASGLICNSNKLCVASGVGSGGTGGVGGSTASVHSRVVAMDPSSNRLAAYDAEGQLVHDYQSLLGFDTSFEDRIVSIEDTILSWDETTSYPSLASVSRAPPGQEPPLGPSEVFVRAKPVGGGSVRLRVANSTGQVTDDFSIPGEWEGFQSSPSRQYFLGNIGGTSGVVVRRSNHGVVWQGALYEAAFAPDDKHLMVIADSNGGAFSTVDLGTGHVTSTDLSGLPAAFSRASLGWYPFRGALNAGALIFVTRTDNSGRSVFLVTWDGTVKPFDPALPPGADEYVLAANGDSTRLIWRRSAYSSPSTIDSSLLGVFELDLASMTNRALPNLPDASGDCYAPNVTNYYQLADGVLLTCACSTTTCTSLASLPAVGDIGWSPRVAVSPARGFVGVDYDWYLSSRLPDDPAPAPLYDSQGNLLLTVDSGHFYFDRLDQLVMARTGMRAAASDTLIYSATSGHTTWLNNPARAVISYE